MVSNLIEFNCILPRYRSVTQDQALDRVSRCVSENSPREMKVLRGICGPGLGPYLSGRSGTDGNAE